ncbi:hypothetical protein FSP39_007668 [Pinctada imbricata]|uniref:SOCS box domain-containing protein n=1 Tax=Pinctada imbricata TaxID=66713 RepID=A0AA88XZA9_PINIB|nr:hypothetical protein FSP39_007668 [Pinctada imbricata]
MDLMKLFESSLSTEQKLQNIISRNETGELDKYLSSGGDPNLRIQKHGGNTIMHEAARQGHFLCVEKLMEYNADPEIKNDFNLTPITLAFRNHYAKCVEILLRVNTELKSLETIWSQLSGAKTIWNTSNDRMLKVLVKATPDLSRTRSNLQNNLFFKCKNDEMYGSLKMIVYGGYKFSQEQINQFHEGYEKDKTFLDWMNQYQKTPQSLQHYCRVAIRHSFHGNCNVMYGAEVLPLPRLTKLFVCIKDED